MTSTQPASLEQLIRACGEGWIIDFFSPKDQAVESLRKALQDASAEAARRQLPIQFTEKMLLATYAEHASQVGAFIQAMGATRNPSMLVMAWRIMQGMTVSRVDVSYQYEKHFALRITLTDPYGNQEEVYESRNINDAALLRHFGIMTMDGKPVFDGFYALKVGK